MKLKDEIREKIFTDTSVRMKIAVDCGKHERTIQRWAEKDSKTASELTTKAVLGVISTYFPEHETILEEQ